MNPISNMPIMPAGSAMPTGGISPGMLPNGIAPGDGAGSTGGAQFKQFMLESINQVNEMQNSAESAIETMATGGDINPAEVLTAVQKADMAFRMMQQIRNKMVQAYQEIQDIRI